LRTSFVDADNAGMTAGRDLNRLLWAVGEARRLRHAEHRPGDGADPLRPSSHAESDEVTAELGRQASH
jgi:hypothetical protein